jgi:uncharacterized membrane protein
MHETRKYFAPSTDHDGLRMDEAITIEQPPTVVYDFWRNLENLPRFMSYLRRITVISRTHSHWEVAGPAGQTIAWETEIITDNPEELIVWRALPASHVGIGGSVHFLPTDKGCSTIVTVALECDPPSGTIGDIIAKLFSDTLRTNMKDDLEILKGALERRATS